MPVSGIRKCLHISDVTGIWSGNLST